jgi:hypothetical protein
VLRAFSIVSIETMPMPMFQTAKPVSDEPFVLTKVGAPLIQLVIGTAISVLFIFAFLIAQYLVGEAFDSKSIERLPEWLQQSVSSLSWLWSWLPLCLFALAGISVVVTGLGWISLAHLMVWRILLFSIFPVTLPAGIAWDAENEWKYAAL